MAIKRLYIDKRSYNSENLKSLSVILETIQLPTQKPLYTARITSERPLFGLGTVKK